MSKPTHAGWWWWKFNAHDSQAPTWVWMDRLTGRLCFKYPNDEMSPIEYGEGIWGEEVLPNGTRSVLLAADSHEDMAEAIMEVTD